MNGSFPEAAEHTVNMTPKYALICLFVFEFWISGLFVLGVIFTQSDDGLDDLTLCTFIAYAIGSFLAGVLSDIFGRRPLFLIASVMLTLSSGLAVEYQFWGYVLANLAIGPLNNLTFVYINEVFPDNSEEYTTLVLIGWAFSEISLGVFFLIFNKQVFHFFVLAMTVIYMLSAALYVPETEEFIKNKSRNSTDFQHQSGEDPERLGSPSSGQPSPYEKSEMWRGSVQNPEKLGLADGKQNWCFKHIIPKTLTPLVCCSVLMFTMQMFYYRTQFTLDTFGISLEINTIVVGCTQTFANVIFAAFLLKFKRRLALRGFIVALMLLLLFLIISSEQLTQTIIEGLMRLFDTGIMIVLGVYIPELFPISERGRGTNFIMSFGVIGSALNGKIFRHLPFWSLEIFLLSALSMTVFLKETKQAGSNLEGSSFGSSECGEPSEIQQRSESQSQSQSQPVHRTYT